MVERLVTTPEAVAVAGELLAAAVTEVDTSRGSARLGVPGGSAAAAVGVMRRSLAPAVWRRVALTWVDERCVPFTDARSNRGVTYAREWLTPASPCAFELPLWLDGEEPDEAAGRVQAGLARGFAGGLDVLLLGLGEDGHVASLFPEHDALSATGGVVFVEDSPKPPPWRMSLTLDLLAQASRVVLLATGEPKREALLRLRANDPSLPASALQHLVVVTDLSLEG